MTNPQETKTINIALLVTQKLEKFVGFIQNLDPELEESEALLLAAQILDRLPEMFASNPNITTAIQQAILVIKSNKP